MEIAPSAGREWIAGIYDRVFVRIDGGQKMLPIIITDKEGKCKPVFRKFFKKAGNLSGEVGKSLPFPRKREGRGKKNTAHAVAWADKSRIISRGFSGSAF
jgi:hypothetical protein